MTSLIPALPYILIVLAVLITAVILMQKSDSNVGGTFGGSDNFGSAYHTRRGFEKTLFNATIILIVLFAAACIAALLLK